MTIALIALAVLAYWIVVIFVLCLCITAARADEAASRFLARGEREQGDDFKRDLMLSDGWRVPHERRHG